MVNNIIIILLLFSFVSCGEFNQNNETEIFKQVKERIKNEEWIKAESLLYTLLKEYKHSSMREENFHALQYVLFQQTVEWNRKFKFIPDTTVPKSSLTLYLSRKNNKELVSLHNKQIDLSKKYLAEFPKGDYKIDFYSHLLSSYAFLGNHSKLFSKSNKDLKMKAAFHLGRYAHKNKNYKKALKYYHYIINNIDSKMAILQYTFYAANCYYELEDMDEAEEYLQDVILMSEELNNEDYGYIAIKMLEYIEQSNIMKDNNRRSFIFFRDPANNR